MHWNCVTVLFSGIRRGSENLLLFEGNTMVFEDKTQLFGLLAGWIFHWLQSHPEKQGWWFLDVCFYIFQSTVVYYIPLCTRAWSHFLGLIALRYIWMCLCTHVCAHIHAHALPLQILHYKKFLLLDNDCSLNQLCLSFDKSLWKKGEKSIFIVSKLTGYS